jgi:hypothetical protein
MASGAGGLEAVFAEAVGPDTSAGRLTVEACVDRLHKLSRLGARWLDIPYVQPALAPDRRRSSRLLLLTFPAMARTRAGGACAAAEAFLQELFTTVEGASSAQDPELRAMLDRLPELRPHGSALIRHQELPTLETPVLSFAQCQVTLHVASVEVEHGPAFHPPIEVDRKDPRAPDEMASRALRREVTAQLSERRRRHARAELERWRPRCQRSRRC